MAPCALSHYVDSDSGTLPKFFKGGYLDVGLPLAYINLSEMKSLSLYLKIKYETSYTLKFIGRKEIFLRPLCSA